jgi:hypothetical protein
VRSSLSPLGAVVRGLAAGVGGTVVMTGYQVAVARLRDSESSSAPAEVGRRIIEGVFQREVPEDRMDDLNNAMHALYGTSWGPVYGVAQSSLNLTVAHHGALFGNPRVGGQPCAATGDEDRAAGLEDAAARGGIGPLLSPRLRAGSRGHLRAA